jgi:hypothetical protein
MTNTAIAIIRAPSGSWPTTTCPVPSEEDTPHVFSDIGQVLGTEKLKIKPRKQKGSAIRNVYSFCVF